jgi:5-methylcytosine-specific restriction protein A
MSPDPVALAERISAETGLEFAGTQGRDSDGTRWVELHPAGHPPAQTFTLRTNIGWRSVDISFQPGAFAADLVSSMRSADEGGRRAFAAVLECCRTEGADVFFTLNDVGRDPSDPSIWADQWRGVKLVVRRGMLALNEGGQADDDRLLALWTGRAAAAVLALLPLEPAAGHEEAEHDTPEVAGLPEGARTRIEVNRYERDRRNRAAAIAIHGYACVACELDVGTRYGAVAAGLIEVHHLTPVSTIGENYVVDPAVDLVPLCPNCHSVAHRRSPPFTVVELRDMMTHHAPGRKTGS